MMETKVNLYLDYIVDTYTMFLKKSAKDASSLASMDTKVKNFRQNLKVIDIGEYIKITSEVNKIKVAHSFILKSNMDIFEPAGWHEPNIRFAVGNLSDRSSYI